MSRSSHFKPSGVSLTVLEQFSLVVDRLAAVGSRSWRDSNKRGLLGRAIEFVVLPDSWPKTHAT